MANTKKKSLVKKLSADIQKSPVVGIVNLENLPAAQLQVMRSTLKKQKVTITMARKRLLHRALEESQKENVAKLIETMQGMPAVLLTASNPFTLYATIQKNKSEASAKPGQIAPRDLVVKAGPTPFAPGPIISELAAVGIKTKVDQGKLAILQDTVIVKEGAVISQKVAETLKRLDIRPMEIGLDLVSVWENGLVFAAKQLHIDEAEYARDITQAAQWALNLAIEAAYPAADTIELLLQTALREAKVLSIEQGILADLTADEILAKAEREALAVKEAGKMSDTE